MRETIEGLVLTLFVGVPLALWDLFWLPTEHNEGRYQFAFLSIFGLEVVTTDVDDVPTEVVRPRDGSLPFWVGVGLFVVSPSSACISGCGQSRVP